MSLIEQGCINIWIDEIVPCLKDTQTGNIEETVVFKIESRADLKKFHKSTGLFGIRARKDWQGRNKNTGRTARFSRFPFQAGYVC